MLKNENISLKVRFKPSQEGGKTIPISGEFYGCPMIIDGEAFDCRLLLNGQVLQLGKWYEVPVKFLNPDIVFPILRGGKKVSLWEGKNVAEGIINLVL